MFYLLFSCFFFMLKLHSVFFFHFLLISLVKLSLWPVFVTNRYLQVQGGFAVSPSIGVTKQFICFLP